MVVVERLSKSTNFIPIQSTYKTVQIADIFMKEIFRLHGIPKTVISDRDVKFTSAFWKLCFSVWEGRYTLVLPIILRLMGRWNR